jgi:AcrR family transcriptional regulator
MSYYLLMCATVARQRTRPTLTEQARRAQIVAAAIETIAELGYTRASFTQIAKRAGLSSTGLISYHFASKKDLDWEIVKEIYDRLTRHMTTAMTGVPDPQAALVGYIQGLIGFMKIDPHALRAMLAIVLHGGFGYDADSEREAVSGIDEILRWGQAEGVFRPFDVQVMATTIQRSLDGIPLAQSTNPDLDLDAYARELVELFTLATQKRD